MGAIVGRKALQSKAHLRFPITCKSRWVLLYLPTPPGRNFSVKQLCTAIFTPACGLRWRCSVESGNKRIVKPIVPIRFIPTPPGRSILHHLATTDNVTEDRQTQEGAVAEWKEFCLVTRRLWVRFQPMPLRSNHGQFACLWMLNDSRTLIHSLNLEW